MAKWGKSMKLLVLFLSLFSASVFAMTDTITITCKLAHPIPYYSTKDFSFYRVDWAPHSDVAFNSELMIIYNNDISVDVNLKSCTVK